MLAWFSLLAWTPSARAATYVLFSAPGVPVRGYDESVRAIQPGDTVVFSNGDRFVVTRRLGNGIATMVFETDDGKALRIPLKVGPAWIQGSRDIVLVSANCMEFMNEFIAGNQTLRELGIPTVALYRSRESEYALVEKLEPRFSYDEFNRGVVPLPAEERLRVFEELLAFARTTWALGSIGDMHSQQLFYTDRGWRVLDSTNQMRWASTIESSLVIGGSFLGIWSPMSQLVHRNATERRQLLAAVQAERRSAGLPASGRCHDLWRWLGFHP